MNRSMMPKQVMAYNQGGIASFIPQQAELMGQPHRLAYVNPQEEQMMLDAGGAGTPGPGGIPVYGWIQDTWNEITSGGEAVTETYNSNDNDDDNNSAPTFDNLTDASNAGYHGQDVNISGQGGLQTVEFADSNYNDQMSNASAAASNDSPGFVNSLLMGLNLKKKTAGYEAATAANLANQQNIINSQDNPTANDDDVQSGGSAPGVVTDGTVTEEDGEPQYTYMPPFYGGYQASTAANTLVPSSETGIASFVPQPVRFAPQSLVTTAANNPPVETTDYTNPLTGVIGEAPVFSGGFNSMEELMAYQNQNPTANLMGEYQRLKALQGGNTTVAGVGNIFGNEPAQPYMYQGIMG